LGHGGIVLVMWNDDDAPQFMTEDQQNEAQRERDRTEEGPDDEEEGS
jgi:hypothetical protein